MRFNSAFQGLKEQVISIYDTLAFVAQFLNLTHIASHSPSSQNVSKFTFAGMLKNAMKMPPHLTPGQDLERQTLRIQSCNILTYIRAI
jgi:hypothetical protein